MDKIIEAAGKIVDGAISILSFVKRFFEKNTPEAALLAAIATAVAAWQAGELPAGAAALAVFTALMTFLITESAKDARTAAAALEGANPGTLAAKDAVDSNA